MDWPRLVPLRKQPDAIYIRFGRWSSNEPSMNWHTGEYERGVSVYPAKLNDDGAAEFDYTNFWVVGDYAALEGRCVWVVTGKRVGTGYDEEPVLMPSTVVARQISIAVSVYEEARKW